MGLFSTVLHIYKKNQVDTVTELKKELQNQGLSKFSKLAIDSTNFEKILADKVYKEMGLYYLVTQPHAAWISIVELNVNIENPFYLYELTNHLSARLNTYALSFHLHDDDVLLYNLDKEGKSLDGYNSDYQYFLAEAANREEIISQRHTPETFSAILPASKNTETLNSILNEGYWEAFDHDDLDSDGVPNDEKYDVDERERMVSIGKYLGIFSEDDYPFADWRENTLKFDLPNCYLLKAERKVEWGNKLKSLFRTDTY